MQLKIPDELSNELEKIAKENNMDPLDVLKKFIKMGLAVLECPDKCFYIKDNQGEHISIYGQKVEF